MSLTYFSEVDDSTLVLVRSDKCSPEALRPQSSEVRALLPGSKKPVGRH
jgi:hypothetical protein